MSIFLIMKVRGGEKMIQEISKQITQYIFLYQEQKESFEVHQYGVEVILSSTIDIVLILLVGWFSHTLVESFIFLCLFWLLRKFSGGYHCQTYAKCISLHVALYVIYLCTQSIWCKYRLVQSVFGLMILLKYSPVHNRELNQYIQKQYKFVSIIIYIISVLISYIKYTGIIHYSLSMVIIMMLLFLYQKYENESI